MELRNENSSGAWLTSYNKYLRDVVGATTATCVRHSRVVRRFIDICHERGTVGWAELSIERVTEFIREDTASKKGHGRRAPACAIRSFLRFLAWRGVVPSGLDRAVPRIRLSRHASLPPHLSPDQLAQLLDGAKSAGAAARRDLAILLLLARLGLRAAEIVALQIDDIDWRTGLLRVRVGKSHRERALPLPHEVGDALADYVSTRSTVPFKPGHVLHDQRSAPELPRPHGNHQDRSAQPGACGHSGRPADRCPHASSHCSYPDGERRSKLQGGRRFIGPSVPANNRHLREAQP
jgi:integrase